MDASPPSSGLIGERPWPTLTSTFIAGALLRGAFALAFPTIHGGDAAARLAHPDTLILGYQLPLPQIFVALARHASDSPVPARIVFCLWGGFLAAALAGFAAVHFGARTAAFVGALAVTDPFLIHYSIVPYQEPVAYSLVALAFILVFQERIGAASLALAAATLARYEAWLFLPAFLWVNRGRARAWAAALPPLVWLAVWQGLAPSGLYVLDIDPAAPRGPRLVFLAKKFAEYEPVLLWLAVLGAIAAFRFRSRALARVLAVVGLAFAVIVGFGHEFPPGSGQMSERLLHLPLLGALLLAGHLLARVSEGGRALRVAVLAVIALLTVRNVRFEVSLLQAAAREPDLALARDVARAIESHRVAGECVTVAAPVVTTRDLQAFIAKVGASYGDVAAAARRAAELSGSSPDRDRIAANLTAPPGTVSALPGCPWRVNVDGADGSSAPGEIVARVAAGPRRAELIRNPASSP